MRYGEGSELLVEAHNGHRRDGEVLSPIVVFTHGGAWGGGSALMYRLLSSCFDRQMQCVTFTHNYDTYPVTDAMQQVEQLRQVLTWAAREGEKFGGDVSRVLLVGHSSGAHLTFLHLLTAPPSATTALSSSAPSSDALSPFSTSPSKSDVRVIGAIGLSGVYNINTHYLYESRRGVHEFSPMKAVCHGPANFDQHSPTCIATQLRNDQQLEWTTPLLLVHGDADQTVPDLESRLLCEAMGGRVRKLGVTVEGRRVAEVGEWEEVGGGGGVCECVIYAESDHASTVLPLMDRTGTHLMDTVRTFIRRCVDESAEAERRQFETAAAMRLEQLKLVSRL